MTALPVVLRGVTVISPPRPPRRGSTVIVEGDRITAVQPDDQVNLEGPATVIDGSGRYLVPGLADMHVHFHRDHAVNRVLAALLLAHGVTTTFCMAGSASVLRLRDAIESQRVIGPSILSTGPIQDDSSLTYCGGRRRARNQRRRGFDAIKVYSNLSREGFEGLCAEAQEHGMPVVGHIVRSVGAEATLGSYQSLVAHAEEFVYSYFGFNLRSADKREPGKLQLDRLQWLAEAAKASGLTLVATLQHFFGIRSQAADITTWMAQQEMSLLPGAVTRGWQPRRNRYASSFSQPYHLRRLKEAADFQLELVRAFHETGVRVLAGTDALATGSMHGVSLHRELSLLAAAGLSHRSVLEAATSSAAAYLGRDFGRIEEGARGDLVLISGDPTHDIGHLMRVIGVVTRGKWLPSWAIWAEHAAGLADCKGHLARTHDMNGHAASGERRPHLEE